MTLSTDDKVLAYNGVFRGSKQNIRTVVLGRQGIEFERGWVVVRDVDMHCPRMLHSSRLALATPALPAWQYSDLVSKAKPNVV